MKKQLRLVLFALLITILVVMTAIGVSAATDGAAVLNPKLKNASYMLLDIKENSARIVFVVKGKTMGAYNLPFGYAVLSDSTVIPEDLLFDYPTADLAVLNAKERAKAKALTVSSDAKRTVDDDDEDDEEVSVFNTATAELPSFIHTDKKARKLPKYMLRETPESAEGFV